MRTRMLIGLSAIGVILCILALMFGENDKASWLQTAITLVAFPALIYEIHLAITEFQRNTEQFEHWRKEINAACKLDVVMFFPDHAPDYLREIAIRREASNKFSLAVTNHGDAPARDIWIQVLLKGPEPIIQQLRSKHHFVVPPSWTRSDPAGFVVCTFRGGRDFVCYPGQTLTLGIPINGGINQNDPVFQDFDLRLEGFGGMIDGKYDLMLSVHHLWADTSRGNQAASVRPLIISVAQD